MQESKITSHGVMTWTGDTAYHMESKSHWDPPMMGKADNTTTQDGQWTGACPAGMKPGDMVMPGGMKMNILEPGTGRMGMQPQ